MTKDFPTTLDWLRRRELNRASKHWAKRDGLPWTGDEDEFLLEFWIYVEPQDRDEITVSQCLERTIEACRVRCEHIRKRLGISVTITVTTVEVEYIGLLDDEEDRWWDPSYYITQKEG